MKKLTSYTSIRILKSLIIFSILCFKINADNIENERKYYELERRQEELEKEKFTKGEVTPKLQSVKEDLTTYYVGKIELIDKYSLLKNKEIKKIMVEYEGKDLTQSQVKELLFELTNKLIEKGYITSRVGISKNGYKENILKLEVHSGKIDQVILNDDRLLDKAKIMVSFPKNSKKVLKLQDIEQLVDNFNNLNSNNIKIDIISGRYNGTSTLVLTNVQDKRYNLNLSYNNYGAESTGRDRGRIDFSYDNLFGINDNIYLIYQRGRNSVPSRSDEISQEYLEKQKFNEDWYVNYTFLFRDWKFDINYSHSFTMNSIEGYSSLYDITGKSTQFNVNFNRLIYRNKYSKFNITGGLRLKNNETYLENISLIDRNLTIGSLGISHSRLFLNGILGIDLSYDRGLPWFEVESDNRKGTKDPKSEFNRYNLIINYYKPIKVGNKQILYKFLGVGQYNNDVLYNSEKIGIGDEYTVRGYKADNISGDSGYYIRNEISYNLDIKKAGLLTPYIGYDYGEVWNNHIADKYKRGYISGSVLGLRYSINEFYLDITYSKPLNVSNYVEKNKEEVYLKFGVRF